MEGLPKYPGLLRSHGRNASIAPASISKKKLRNDTTTKRRKFKFVKQKTAPRIRRSHVPPLDAFEFSIDAQPIDLPDLPLETELNALFGSEVVFEVDSMSDLDKPVLGLSQFDDDALELELQRRRKPTEPTEPANPTEPAKPAKPTKPATKSNNWREDEDHRLVQAVKTSPESLNLTSVAEWETIAAAVETRSAKQCKRRLIYLQSAAKQVQQVDQRAQCHKLDPYSILYSDETLRGDEASQCGNPVAVSSVRSVVLGDTLQNFGTSFRFTKPRVKLGQILQNQTQRFLTDYLRIRYSKPIEAPPHSGCAF